MSFLKSWVSSAALLLALMASAKLPAARKVWLDGEGEIQGLTWVDPTDAKQGAAEMTTSTARPHKGKGCVKVVLSWIAPYYGGAFGYNWAAWDKAKAIDISKAKALEFWV